MSEDTNEKAETTTVDDVNAAAGDKGEKKGSLVDALFDIGLTWAAHGLKVAKSALEASGKTLDTTAKTLERLADELTKKDGEEKKAA